jgi:hypothetical protein
VFGIPLLIIPCAIYNIVTFLMPGAVNWTGPVETVHLPSGADWTITAADVFLAGSILLLLFEMVRAGRAGTRPVVDHLLSVALLAFIGYEFAMIPQTATSTFFLLGVISFVDVIGGFTISIMTVRRRHVVVEHHAEA